MSMRQTHNLIPVGKLFIPANIAGKTSFGRTLSIGAMTYPRMLYIFAIIKWNHFEMYTFGVVGETHAHGDCFEVILL